VKTLGEQLSQTLVAEGHRARGGKVLGQDERKANNPLTFMVDIARRTRHLLLGTATPIQTHVTDFACDFGFRPPIVGTSAPRGN
jgi:hypothetical protein